jgi:hypothetical protein
MKPRSPMRWTAGVCLVLLVFLVFLLGGGVLAAASPSVSNASKAADPGWPRTVEKGDIKLVYYQPQIESWKDYKVLTARIAFTVTKAGKQAAGVVKIQADTLTDTETRTVVIQRIAATEVHFPSLDSTAEERAKQRFSELFPTAGMTVSLDRLIAALEKTNAPAPRIAVKDDPPPIFVSESPAILLFVDGEPVYAPIEGTQLKFVVNTNWDLFYNEPTSHYYLLDGKVWRTSQQLGGPWEATRTLPADMSKLPSGQNFDDVKKVIPPPVMEAKPIKILYTNKPAEIIVFQGKPQWKDIPPTKLRYAQNTESDIFLDGRDLQHYFLVSGRWFRAKSLEGPWTYASNDLPADFKAIPAKSVKGDVLASVPGTEEAIDAVLLAQIPTTVVVNKAEAEKAVKVNYAGDPKFDPIPDTSMSYATNTQDKVIKIGDLYYLCFQGVWFMSTKPSGPWKTCDSVPKEIYTIPASSPVYNVTYVTVSNPTTTTVEASYTSGYMGAFVVGMSYGACVVYGTGWYYPPYYWYGPYPYPVYWPYPYAYGYGAWYNTATGRYGYGGAVYGPYGAAGGAAWYNPSTGRYGRATTVQTPYGGRTWSSSYNPYTGVASARAGGWSPYGSWGSSAVQRGDDWAVSNRVSNSQGTVRQTYTSEGGSMTKVRTDQGTVRVGQDANNNVYAGKDGNVYKRDSSGDWSKYDNGSWNSVDKPQKAESTGTREASSRSSTSASTMESKASSSGGSSWKGSDVSRDLNREASSRSTGSQRAQSWSSGSRSSGSFSGGGGGMRGGGGGRRR